MKTLGIVAILATLVSQAEMLTTKNVEQAVDKCSQTHIEIPLMKKIQDHMKNRSFFRNYGEDVDSKTMLAVKPLRAADTSYAYYPAFTYSADNTYVNVNASEKDVTISIVSYAEDNGVNISLKHVGKFPTFIAKSFRKSEKFGAFGERISSELVTDNFSLVNDDVRSINFVNTQTGIQADISIQLDGYISCLNDLTHQ